MEQILLGAAHNFKAKHGDLGHFVTAHYKCSPNIEVKG